MDNELLSYINLIYGNSNLNPRTLKQLEHVWKTNPKLIIVQAQKKLNNLLPNVELLTPMLATSKPRLIPIQNKKVVQPQKPNNDYSHIDNFKKAFRAATNAGLKTFKWKKNWYTTEQAKPDTSKNIKKVDVHPKPVSKTYKTPEQESKVQYFDGQENAKQFAEEFKSKLFDDIELAPANFTAVKDNTRVTKTTNYKHSSDNVESIFNIAGWLTKVKNYIQRKKDMYFGEDESSSGFQKPINTKLKEPTLDESKKSYTGDTIQINKRQYTVPESINVRAYTYGYRNRGDNTEINSESAPITTFYGFQPFGKHDKKYNTYIGIDPNGVLKVGDISQFSKGDYLTGTYANNIREFKKDQNNNLLFDKSRKNPSQNQPIAVLYDETGTKDPKDLEKQSINVLVSRNDKQGTGYGRITGGRVLVKVGDELRLISGSAKDINDQFEEMKKRNNADYGTFYTLDNGTYNKGLRTYDQKFTSEDLKQYDTLNNGGGNFLYITGENNSKKIEYLNLLRQQIKEQQN